MALTPGTRLGPYEIVAALGAGGMGEVYRARDTKLKREVALKILPDSFANDPDRLARFQREAQVLASLNHPNIAHIHGLEDSGGVRALVMELVEGEDLAQRLIHGAIPIDEALPIAKQIAEALEAAHEQGIIHRDLKPANIKVRADGTVKVLDFGLAKAMDPLASSPRVSQSPTITSPAMTAAGVILGTTAYMSPEQARGKPVDKRADIWAFGCVLYEMLSGRAVFARPTLTDTLSAVVDREPDWSVLPSDTPPGIRRLLERCLAKDVRRRVRDVGDARLEIDDSSRAPLEPLVASGSFPAPFAWSVGAFAVLTIAGVMYYVATHASSRASATMPASIGRPMLVPVTAGAGLALDPAISRDGSLIAYASDRAGHDDLDVWVQQAAGGAPIRVTHDAIDESEPAFSPDGARIVFRSERDGGGLFVVPALGGQEPRLLAPQGRRPRFSPDGQLIAYWTGPNIGFSNTANSYRVLVVPASGGTPTPLTGFTAARYPVWSPDGQSLLVLGSRDDRPTATTYDWWLAPLHGGEPIRTRAYEEMRKAGVAANGFNGNMGPSDWRNTRVLFSDFRHLWSLDLDARTARSSNVERLTFGTSGDVAPSEAAGSVISFSSFSSANNTWAIPIDANKGVVTGTPLNITTNGARPTATIDGQLVAYYTALPRPSVLVKDLKTGSLQDLDVTGSAFGPAISPTGERVAFESGRNVSILATRGGAPRVICEECSIGDWAADGRSFTVVKPEGPGGNAGRLLLIDVDRGVSRDLVVSSAAPLSRPFLSPDSTLLAFRITDSSGERIMIAHVQPQDAAIERDWLEIVAHEGDVRPCGWSPSGGLLYFVSSRDGTRCLYACRIDRTTGRPQGSAFVVRHFHGSRNILSGAFGVLSTGPGNAIRGGFLFYDLATFSSNIWQMTPSDR